jgi:FG-GAP-like repeat
METAHSTRAQAADLDGDGWLDLIFSNQIESGSQFSSTLIYWGGPQGFIFERHTRLPTWGGYGICVADYNRDGHLDIAVPSYKGFRTRTTESRVFWGAATGFSDTNYSVLQTDSGAECMAADFNNDGWTDLLILCHRSDANSHAPGHPADHSTNSFLYWSGPDGFSRKPALIPTVGAHCNNSVDYGNVYDRKLRWGYTSMAFEFAERVPRTIAWEAKTPFHTFARFQVRTAPTVEALSKAAWHGPRGAGAYYEHSGEALGALGAHDRWIQYRFELGYAQGTGNPEVTAVEFR